MRYDIETLEEAKKLLADQPGALPVLDKLIARQKKNEIKPPWVDHRHRWQNAVEMYRGVDSDSPERLGAGIAYGAQAGIFTPDQIEAIRKQMKGSLAQIIDESKAEYERLKAEWDAQQKKEEES